MNDRVEEIYTQMFAPQPIPKSVREMYDRAVFLANRIDCQLTVGALVMLAASATKSATTSVSKPIEPEAVDIHKVGETIPAQPELATDAPTEPPQPPPEQQTGEADPNGPETPAHALTGPMDAPEGPTTEHGRNSLEIALNGMSKDELIAHAKDVCGMSMKKIIGRTKKGKVTKSDIQQRSRPKIIETILGQKNG